MSIIKKKRRKNNNKTRIILLLNFQRGLQAGVVCIPLKGVFPRVQYLCTKKLGPVETGVVLFPEKIEKCGVFREGLLLTGKGATLRTPRGCWLFLVRFRRVEMRKIEFLAGDEFISC